MGSSVYSEEFSDKAKQAVSETVPATPAVVSPPGTETKEEPSVPTPAPTTTPTGETPATP